MSNVCYLSHPSYLPMEWKVYLAAFILDIAILATLLVVGLKVHNVILITHQLALGILSFSAIVLPITLMAGP